MSIIQSLVNLSQCYSNHCFIVEITIGRVDEEVSRLKLELSFSATMQQLSHPGTNPLAVYIVSYHFV
jgi:hypothetical protein